MKTNCLIVDDEPIAVEVIKSHLQNFKTLEVTGIAGNAIQASELIGRQQIDLIFLDIRMPQITGLDFIRSLTNPPKVIITTAYRDYAMDGYELDVVDYLLKPISFERFLKAIQKYFQMVTIAKSDEIPYRKPNESIRHIFVRADRKTMKIALQQIMFIESIKDYVKIHTKEKVIITKEQISQLEINLPSDQFMRIHRSFIIAIDKIEAFSNETIELAGKELPIGRSYKHVVISKLHS